MNSTRPKPRPIVVLLAAIFASFLSTGAFQAAASGVCASADIAEPFRLPSGALQSPARLTLCDRGDFSPVASFHEVRVDRMPIGLLTSRRQAGENDSNEPPFMMFERGADGTLTLLGYAYPSRGGMRTYDFSAAASPALARERVTRASSAEPPVLVAADLD